MALFSHTLAKIRRSLSQRRVEPVEDAASITSNAVLIHPFDTAHSVDTSGLIPSNDLATGRKHDPFTTGYYGMAPSRFHGAIERWMASTPAAPIEEYSFVDLGCGKGRALMLASTYSFAGVSGVELNGTLAKTARKNMRIWQAANPNAASIRVRHGDASRYTFPDGPCLLYMFHPFGRPVMNLVLHNLARTFADRPQQLDIIYFNPEEAGAIEGYGGFKLMWSEVIPMSDGDAAVDPVANPTDLCNAYRWIG